MQVSEVVDEEISQGSVSKPSRLLVCAKNMDLFTQGRDKNRDAGDSRGGEALSIFLFSFILSSKLVTNKTQGINKNEAN